MQSTLRISTRKSPLALWQANAVKTALTRLHPQLQVEIIGLVTEGDKHLTSSLATIGGKGLFVKELQLAILQGRADIAVHSIKDMPTEPTDQLRLAAVCKRDDPRDVLVGAVRKRAVHERAVHEPPLRGIDELPAGAIVGTSSSRRACLLRQIRPDLRVENLRGNVGTRLKKLDAGEYDAIILAASGLHRLGEDARISCYLEPEAWIPAVGQGAIGIECHENNAAVQAWLTPLNHPPSQVCITAERAFNQRLGGGCQLPIAAYATWVGAAQLHIRGFVAHPHTTLMIAAELTGRADKPQELGIALAEVLLERGARDILPLP